MEDATEDADKKGSPSSSHGGSTHGPDTPQGMSDLLSAYSGQSQNDSNTAQSAPAEDDGRNETASENSSASKDEEDEDSNDAYKVSYDWRTRAHPCRNSGEEVSLNAEVLEVRIDLNPLRTKKKFLSFFGT